MNDKELADAVVALLPSIYRPGDYYRLFDVWHDDLVPGTMFSDIVRDWRVAGALMVLVYESYATLNEVTATFEGDPRAIIDACVEALT